MTRCIKSKIFYNDFFSLEKSSENSKPDFVSIKVSHPVFFIHVYAHTLYKHINFQYPWDYLCRKHNKNYSSLPCLTVRLLRNYLQS